MARDSDDLDALIGLIYEAASDPGLWSRAMLDFSVIADGAGAHLVVFDKTLGRRVSAVAGARSMAPDFMDRFLEHYARINPFQALLPATPAGTLLLCGDHVSEDFIRRSEFYQEFLLPAGGRYQAGWMLVNDDRFGVLLDLHRREAPFERAEAAPWTRIAGHFRRAIRLGASLEDARARANARDLAGDNAGLVWLLVDGSARLLDSSRAAVRVLTQGALLRVGHGRRLQGPDATQTGRLHGLVAAVATGRGGGPLVLSGRDGAVACLEALPCGVNAPGVFRPDLAACALLSVREPARPQLLHAAAVRAALNCTKAEAEVAICLAAGLSPAAIAAARGVSLTTVRSQIRALFLAADVTRIGELVARLNGHAPTAP